MLEVVGPRGGGPSEVPSEDSYMGLCLEGKGQ